MSENCLFLNVQTPASVSSGDKLPVIVWIHGGGFKIGSAAASDPSKLLQLGDQKNVRAIWVAMNYRLSGWGFLTGTQAQAAGASNAGILDQRAALQWVQNNIQAFGGDPTKVLLAGQSAGAISVAAHLLRDGGNTHGLYRAAAMLSGSANSLSIGAPSFKQEYFNSLTKKAGCSGAKDPMACLSVHSPCPFQFRKLRAKVDWLWTRSTSIGRSTASFTPRPTALACKWTARPSLPIRLVRWQRANLPTFQSFPAIVWMKARRARCPASTRPLKWRLTSTRELLSISCLHAECCVCVASRSKAAIKAARYLD